MRLSIGPIIVVLAILHVPSARAQPAPASAPTSAPAETETLAEGKVLFAAPAEWTLLGKRPDDLSAGYASPDKSGQIVIVTAPQPQPVRDELAPRLAATIRKAIDAEGKKGNIEIVEPARVEKDPRVLLKIHDRFRSKGKLGDRVQFFRGVGSYLVSVTATAFTEDAEQARSIHDAAERVALSVKLARPAGKAPASQRASSAKGRTTAGPASRPTAGEGPVIFREAKIQAAPPPGWVAEMTGAASGLIVTWRDPADTSNLIALTLRSLPAEARNDAALRDLAVEQIADGERQMFSIEGAQPAGKTRVIADRRFLRKTRSEYEAHGVQFCITSRQLRVGDSVASVTMIALQDKADAIDALADRVGTEIKPAR